MKNMLSIALICVSLLITGCKRNTDSVVQPSPSLPASVSTTQPTSTTVPAELAVTDVATLTVVTPPPLTMPNCRIVKEITKEAFGGPIDPANNPAYNPEIILVDGKKITVYNTEHTEYKYDQQGRISKILYGTNTIYPKNFQYSKQAIYTEETQNRDNVGLYIQRDTIVLNEQGYQKYYEFNYRTNLSIQRLYDDEGHFIGYKGAERPQVLIENGNYVKYWDYVQGIQTGIYTYDLTRKGLPNPLQYLGNNYPSINLVTKRELYSEGYYLYRDGLLTTAYYYYKYDQYGRIVCQIRYDKINPGSGYPFFSYAGGLAVIYYEYECP